MIWGKSWKADQRTRAVADRHCRTGAEAALKVGAGFDDGL